MNIKNHIPNVITILNIYCGCLGLAFAHAGNIGLAALLMIAAAIFDFSDGFVARMLNAKSKLGEQLDSLADLVSFGVLPAFIILEMFNMAAMDTSWARRYHLEGANAMSLYIFIFTAAAALRLAIFNTSSDQQNSFKGMPSPAAGLFLGSFALVYAYGLQGTPFDTDVLEAYVLNANVLFAAPIALGVLMLLPVRLLSLKFANFSFGENVFRYLLIIGALTLIPIFGFLAIQLIVLLYLILSVIQNIVTK